MMDRFRRDLNYRGPNAEELELYYNVLETGAFLELDWRCPGRRAPSPGVDNGNQESRHSSAHTPETHE